MLHNAIEIAEERLIDFDQSAHEFVAPVRDTAFAQPLTWFSKLGDQPQVRLISGAVLVAGLFTGKDRMVRAGARMIIAHEAATLVKDLVKTDVDRTRPRSAESRKEKKLRKGTSRAKEKSSFPSGHSAGAIAAARAFSREYPEHGALALGGAAAVAVSQVPREAHYPTDVAAGLSLGVIAEALVDVLWRAVKMDERSRSED